MSGPPRRPPWWPEGEAWPPARPPWHWRRRRRGPLPRLAFAALGCFVGVAVVNTLLGLVGYLVLPTTAAGKLLAAAFLLVLLLLIAAGSRRLVRGLRRSEAERAQVRRARLAEVAHELRTPLAVIRGEAEAIGDGVHPADPEHLGRIRDAVAAIEALVADLGSLTDTEAGPMPLRVEPVEVAGVVAAAVDALRETAAAGGVELETKVAAGLPAPEWDGARVRRALQNLLANAIRHSPPGGTVAVSAAASEGGVTLTVTDTGAGFDPAILARAFDRYVKDAASPGSGLGLAIAREIAEAHGGRASAENRPGSGAAVSLWLPDRAGRGPLRS